MRTLKSLMMAGTVGLMVVVSCSKDDDNNNNNNSSTPDSSPPTPELSDADGACWAIRTVSTQQTIIGPIEIEVGVAVGAFFGTTGGSSLVDVGTVSVDGNDLAKQSNNSYLLTPGLTNPTGLDFTTNVVWEVAGGNGFSAFMHTDDQSWPAINGLFSPDTFAISNGYTFQLSGVSGCDSVLFAVGDVVKFVSGNASSCTFSAAELSGLASGVNYVNAAGIRLEAVNQGSKKVYFGKEYVQGKTVYITN